MKKRRRREKSNGYTLSFYNSHFGERFWPKKTVGRKRPIWPILLCLSHGLHGNGETMESWKIGNFAPKASESCLNFNISNVGCWNETECLRIFFGDGTSIQTHEYSDTEYKNSKDIIFYTITYTRLCKLFANDKQALEVGWYLFNRLSPQLNG